jgi:methionyl-tRNA formyltransferase
VGTIKNNSARVEDVPTQRRIRTVFCTSGGILGSIVLSRLIQDEGIEVVGIVRSCRVFDPKMSFPRGAIRFFMRCGIPYTIYLWFITTVAECVGIFLRSGYGSTSAIAKHNDIPIFTTRDINQKTGHEYLSRLSPDLLISAYFDQKFGKELCDGQKYAAVNIHPSPLPLRKGVDPVFHALLQGDSKMGVTIHRISEKYDSGAIIAREELDADPKQSVLSTTAALLAIGSEMLLSSHALLLDCSASQTQQQMGTYDSWPSSKEVRQLYRGGGNLLCFKDLVALFYAFSGSQRRIGLS